MYINLHHGVHGGHREQPGVLKSLFLFASLNEIKLGGFYVLKLTPRCARRSQRTVGYLVILSLCFTVTSVVYAFWNAGF